MITRVVSGGQTGADQGGLFAARAAGIGTGGWAAKGWLVEGPGGRGWEAAPWLADYALKECPADGFPARTAMNVRDSDFTAWFGPTGSSGFVRTWEECDRLDRPMWLVGSGPSSIQTPAEFVTFLRRDGHLKVMNVAGSRASKEPTLQARVERFLAAVFRAMAPREVVER